MPISELRFDLVSKDWVVIAPGRGRRPETFVRKEEAVVEQAITACPFCDLTEQATAVLVKIQNSRNIQVVSNQALTQLDWQIVVIPNKYPAFGLADDLNERAVGPYQVSDGVGFHEVVIYRDHIKPLTDFSVGELKSVISVMRQRYLELMDQKFVNYISVFHNQGQEAGASVSHPHSQIIAIPVIDPDLRRSLEGSQRYFNLNHHCVHCAMMKWDLENGERIVFENDQFVVLVPFASRVSFEMRIYPRQHKSYFERITDNEIMPLAEALQQSLSRLAKKLNYPAYNFFIHTSPCDGHDYDHYHWHVEILPKTSTWAGFELGTGIEILTIAPEQAAGFLRS